MNSRLRSFTLLLFFGFYSIVSFSMELSSLSTTSVSLNDRADEEEEEKFLVTNNGNPKDILPSDSNRQSHQKKRKGESTKKAQQASKKSRQKYHESYETHVPEPTFEQLKHTYLKEGIDSLQPIFKIHDFDNFYSFIDSVKTDLSRRQPRQIMLAKHAFDPLHPPSKETLSQFLHVSDDADIYYQDGGQVKLLARVRKELFSSSLLEELARASFMHLPTARERYKRAGGNYDDPKTVEYEKLPNFPLEYHLGTILGKDRHERYGIKDLYPARKSTTKKLPTKKINPTFSAYQGRIGKLPQGTKIPSSNADISDELIASLSFSKDNTFLEGETILFPLEKTLLSVSGYLPGKTGQPARLTREAYVKEKFPYFIKSLMFVEFSRLIYNAIDPESFKTQQESASKGPNLIDSGFTTFDVNINIPTTWHQDHNSFDPSNNKFMTALIKFDKNVTGNELYFPEFDVAINGNNGFILFDAERYHGNPFLRTKSREETGAKKPPKRTPVGGLQKEINPDSFAVSFVLFKKDELQNKLLARELLKQETSVAISHLDDVEIKSAQLDSGINDEKFQKFPWTVAKNNLEIKGVMTFKLNNHVIDQLHKTKPCFFDFLNKEIAANFAIFGQQTESQRKLGFDLEKTVDNFSVKVDTFKLLNRTIDYAELEAAFVIRFNFQHAFTSCRNKTLFDLSVFGRPLCKDILVGSRINELNKKLNADYSINPKYIRSAFWYDDFLKIRNANLGNVRSKEQEAN